jgi:hypothetical protein
MGHMRALSGRWELNPPLSYAEYRESEFAPDRGGSPGVQSVFTFEVESIPTDTEEGVLEIRRAVAIVPRQEDPASWRMSFVNDELFELWRRYSEIATGEIRAASTERQGDVQRWTADAKGGAFEHEVARLVWEDGSPVEPL